ncbi:MAG: hypothetical protein KF708_24540 [Pirellulales bacterium]|nr:hypothetical protein [Pirellulales bacterium]
MDENPYETPQMAPEAFKKAPLWVRIVSAALLTMSALVFVFVGLGVLGAIVAPESIGPQGVDWVQFILGALCFSSVGVVLLAIGVLIRLIWLIWRKHAPP